jgi:hypothetical protein
MVDPTGTAEVKLLSVGCCCVELMEAAPVGSELLACSVSLVCGALLLQRRPNGRIYAACLVVRAAAVNASCTALSSAMQSVRGAWRTCL